MATFKMEEPPRLTGDNARDVSALNSYICNLHSQLRYMFTALDEDNMTDSIKNRLNIKEEK